jgi:ribosomal protein S27AE
MKRERTISLAAPFFLLRIDCFWERIYIIMIRVFTALCNTIAKNILCEASLFEDAVASYKPLSEKCPHCGVTGYLIAYGSYERFLVSIVGNEPAEQTIKPTRYKCGKCGATHALLPDILIPYSSYSLLFVLSVLIAYYERATTVAALCVHYGIAVSTLYSWKKRFLSHKQLLLGVIVSQKEAALTFLHDLFNSPGCWIEQLQTLFHKHGFSFMQNSRAASQSLPP